MASRAIVKAIQNPNNEFILKATLKSVTLAHLSFDVLKHYEKKRPSGMVLDASGAFTVANLLDVWGRALCLTEAGVMAAAKKHMFKDSKEPGSRCQKEAAEEDQAGIPRSSGPPEVREEIQGSKGLLERPGSARIKGTSG